MYLYFFALLSIFSFVSCSSQKQVFTSPFKSEVEGLSVPNANWIGGGKRLLRSMEPRGARQFQEIKNLGVTDVLIFKPSKEGEVESEVEHLSKTGISLSQIHNIPFKWKEIYNFREACEQTLQGLRLLRDVEKSSNRRLLLHCTVGEDRTGYLAGLYLFLKDPSQDLESLFQQELCKHGFGAANPEKPMDKVVSNIRASLTPLFLKMAYKIKQRQLRLETLDSNQCANDPENLSKFQSFLRSKKLSLICRPQ